MAGASWNVDRHDTGRRTIWQTCSATRKLRRAWREATGRVRGTKSSATGPFKDFASAISFVNRVAEIAEAANHHPDILVHGWNKVRLSVTNHAAGGLTDADFELAKQVDDLG